MNFRRLGKFSGVIGLAVVFFIGGGEIWLWRSGYGDFPLYDVDPEIGYVPKPSQAGVFAEKYIWYFNAHSMRSQPFYGNAQRDILLLGDSIVFGGGIDYQPQQRLGECMQAIYPDGRVWAAAAGSWGVLNELTYLERHPDVVGGVKKIIWIVNAGDFAGRSQWASPYTHPIKKPIFLGFYLIGKWWSSHGSVYFRSPASEVEKIAESAFCEEARERLQRLPDELRAKCRFILYPSRVEHEQMSRGKMPAYFKNIQNIFSDIGLNMTTIGFQSAEAENFYRDGIHPTANGNVILARIIMNAQ